VPVSHEADIEKVEEIYSNVFSKLKASDEWRDEINKTYYRDKHDSEYIILNR
jgi:hypothetical protein